MLNFPSKCWIMQKEIYTFTWWGKTNEETQWVEWNRAKSFKTVIHWAWTQMDIYDKIFWTKVTHMLILELKTVWKINFTTVYERLQENLWIFKVKESEFHVRVFSLVKCSQYFWSCVVKFLHLLNPRKKDQFQFQLFLMLETKY